MKKSNYKLSFTAGAALLQESIVVAEIKIKAQTWKEAKAIVIEKNALQARTESTLKRLSSEIIARLETLSEEELLLLINGEESEQKQLIWLSICRQNTLIRDFAIEVIKHHFDMANYSLTPDDYTVFFNAKADWHDNLNKASELTKYKTKQVLFKILRECGLLNPQSEIVSQSMSHRLSALIKKTTKDDLTVFPGVAY
jgi:hypothetical protein